MKGYDVLRSLVYIRNNRGPSTETWIIPIFGNEFILQIINRNVLCPDTVISRIS